MNPSYRVTFERLIANMGLPTTKGSMGGPYKHPQVQQFYELFTEFGSSGILLGYNTAIDECVDRTKAYAYMSPNFDALAEELEGMKQ